MRQPLRASRFLHLRQKAHDAEVEDLRPLILGQLVEGAIRRHLHAGGDEAADVPVHRRPLGLALRCQALQRRSEEHTSELKSLMRISYAVFCLKKKNILVTSIDD